ncbi:MAG: hypothetical protein ACOZAO_04715 [Patescibacteria group bacterium]
MNRNKVFIIFLIVFLLFLSISLIYVQDNRYKYPGSYITMDLPIYADAVVLDSSTKKSDHLEEMKVELLTNDTEEEISAYYKAELRSRGWGGPDDISDDLPDDVYYKLYEKNKDEFYLRIEAKDTESFVSIKVKNQY